jgi:WD40 repeat protein
MTLAVPAGAEVAVAERGGPDGRFFFLAPATKEPFEAAFSTDGDLELWDTASGELRSEQKGHGRPVRALALSPDGTKVVTASEDTTLLVWEVPQ